MYKISMLYVYYLLYKINVFWLFFWGIVIQIVGQIQGLLFLVGIYRLYIFIHIIIHELIPVKVPILFYF